MYTHVLCRIMQKTTRGEKGLQFVCTFVWHAHTNVTSPHHKKKQGESSPGCFLAPRTLWCSHEESCSAVPALSEMNAFGLCCAGKPSRWESDPIDTLLLLLTTRLCDEALTPRTIHPHCPSVLHLFLSLIGLCVSLILSVSLLYFSLWLFFPLYVHVQSAATVLCW